ncbi:MAG: hypothetical protein GXZ15_03910 [Campylobacter sp.]|nr:hypothetical protein [Campylobacter sp.]
MIYTYEVALWVHRFLSILFVAFTFVLLIFSQKGEGVSLMKRVRYFYPLYAGVLTAIILTGLVMMPIVNFDITFRVLLMVTTSVVICGLLGSGYSALKRAYYTRKYDGYKYKMKIYIAIILGLNLLIWIV